MKEPKVIYYILTISFDINIWDFLLSLRRRQDKMAHFDTKVLGNQWRREHESSMKVARSSDLARFSTITLWACILY